MKKFVLTENAKLQCSCGSSLSELKVTSHTFNYVCDYLQATEGDNKSGENIKSFGSCSQTKGVCSPQPLQWKGIISWNEVNGKASLTDKSTLPCALGGLISCKENSQYHFGFEDKEDSVENESMVDKSESEESEKREPKAYVLLRDGTLEEEDLPVLDVDRIYKSNEFGYIDLEKAEQIKNTWEEYSAVVYDDDISENNKKTIAGTFYCFIMKTKEKAKEVFEFLAMNSDLEFSYTQLDKLFVIGTCKHKTTVDNSKKITFGLVMNAKNAEFVHSHPKVQGMLNEKEGYPDSPSGFNTKSGMPTEKGGDRRDASTKLKYNSKSKFYVLSCLYSEKEGLPVYIQYNDKKFDYTRAKKYYDSKGSPTYYEYEM